MRLFREKMSHRLVNTSRPFILITSFSPTGGSKRDYSCLGARVNTNDEFRAPNASWLDLRWWGKPLLETSFRLRRDDPVASKHPRQK